MKKDLAVAPKPNPENALIRALRVSAQHLRKRAAEPRSPSDLFVAARMCDEEIAREVERMRDAGEASS